MFGGCLNNVIFVVVKNLKLKIMKSTGRYYEDEETTDEERLQGQIDGYCDTLKNWLSEIDKNQNSDNAKEIKKAIMDTVIHSI